MNDLIRKMLKKEINIQSMHLLYCSFIKWKIEKELGGYKNKVNR
jgi:hypothetical protein